MLYHEYQEKRTCFYLTFVLTFRSCCFMLRLLMLCQLYSRHSHYSCPCFGLSFSENLKKLRFMQFIFCIEKEVVFILHVTQRPKSLLSWSLWKKWWLKPRFSEEILMTTDLNILQMFYNVFQVQSGPFSHLNINVFFIPPSRFFKKAY